MIKLTTVKYVIRRRFCDDCKKPFDDYLKENCLAMLAVKQKMKDEKTYL